MSKEQEPKKPGIFRRAASYAWHTLADDPAKIEDDRDIFQMCVDAVMGPTPGRKVTRTAAAAGAGTAVAGICTGSVTTLTIGGITFIVGGVAEGLQWYRGHKNSKGLADAPQVKEITDEQAVGEVGVASAAAAKSNVHAVLKDVATSTFGWTEAKFEQLWSKIKGHEKGGQKLNGKDAARYRDLVTVASNLGRVQLADAPAAS